MSNKIPEDWELYDENNPEHNNPKLFEVMEYETVLDSVSGKATIEEDAERRDFCNSSIYLRLKDKALIDPTGEAINDCLGNILKFNGKPKERLAEDPLRTIRFYRFVQRGWEPDKKSLKAVRESFDEAIKNVSATRIMNELEKMVGLK